MNHEYTAGKLKLFVIFIMFFKSKGLITKKLEGGKFFLKKM